MSLPANCSHCTMWRDKLCRRHAPSPRSDTIAPLNQPAFWPQVQAHQKCGVGSTTDEPTNCGKCIHFDQPDGKPISCPPLWGMMGKSKEWWDNSGYCTHWAAGPSATPDQKVSWFVTSSIETECCGDGEPVEEEGTV